MNRYKKLNIQPGNAICYSGYRKGQSPNKQIYPSYQQVKEDLLILSRYWKYLRLYDSGRHSEIVLEVIQKEKLEFKVMLGAFIAAEMNNFGCPWGAIYPEKVLKYNRKRNIEEIDKLIELANHYPGIIFSLSAGNEATVDWTDHFVSVENVIEYVKRIKKGAPQPVTFCENYVPWHNKLEKLVEELDFISIHTYPVWEYKHIHEALEYTKKNFFGVANKYPQKPVIITEAGWATQSSGRGIDPENASEEYQEIYFNDLMEWSEKEGIITFVFEAFDEPWKGSNEKLEPEKHWGLFYENRKPKKVMRAIYKEG
jgi:exo-beta-1,3-glucanase (GH17 family)